MGPGKIDTSDTTRMILLCNTSGGPFALRANFGEMVAGLVFPPCLVCVIRKGPYHPLVFPPCLVLDGIALGVEELDIRTVK